MGLTMDEALSVPFGYLQDLIAIDQIKNDEADRVLSTKEESDEFTALFSRK